MSSKSFSKVIALSMAVMSMGFSSQGFEPHYVSKCNSKNNNPPDKRKKSKLARKARKINRKKK